MTTQIHRLLTPRPLATAVALGLILSWSGLAQAQPSASVTILPPGAPAPTPEASSEDLGDGPGIATAVRRFDVWTCEAYAAAPEPGVTAQAYLELTVDGAVVSAFTFWAEYFGTTHSLSANIPAGSQDQELICNIFVECVNSYCGSTSGSASAQVPATIPDGETTARAGWIHETRYNFSQTLTPGSTSFSGRKVREQNGGGGQDGCYFDGSSYDPFDKVTGGDWTVGSGNVWQYDQIGYGFLMVRYYREERPNRGLPMPCETRFLQTMQINVSQTQWRTYKTNELKAGITATTVWVERDTVREEKPWK